MLVRLIFSALSVAITAWLMDTINIEPWWACILVAIVLGLINSIIRPVVKFLSFPVNVLTLGLFSFVINALMVMLCAWFLDDYFKIEAQGFNYFLSALIFSIVLSVVGWILNLFNPKKKK